VGTQFSIKDSVCRLLLQSIKGEDVEELLNDLKYQKKEVPQRIQVDNGTEIISKAWDLWAYENDVTLDYSRPGKPTDNPFIESLKVI
jgi:putative transposase